MVVFPRREIHRLRTGNLLGLLLGSIVLVSAVRGFSQSGDGARILLILTGLIAIAIIAIALIDLISHRGTSKVILFHLEDKTIIAVNLLHEGYKLRLLRDILNDNISAFTDEERQQWSVLETEGFHAVFKVRNVRKTFLLPILFMIFDDVFVLDHTNRWDYFDCRNTSEPTSSRRGVGPLNDESILPEGKRQPAT